MGLYVSHLKNLPYGERSLYVYLLDYGWPEGPYEKIFRDNFQAMAQRASETGSIVIASHRGVHFANEVLNWHSVNGIDADTVLPAILITKAHPNYFVESMDESRSAGEGLGEIVLIPLKAACTSPNDFAMVIESVFADLEKGLALSRFRISSHDATMAKESNAGWRGLASRIGRSILLEPNVAGVGVDLKKLFSTG
jgi:hypothetical protein